VLAEQNIIEPINKLLLPALKKDASVEFLHQLRVLPISKPDELIHAVQKQLHQHPQSSKWLSCLGHLAYHSKQWAMSEKAFNSLFNLETPDYDKQDLIVCAKVKSKQNDFQGANSLLLKTISTV
jgi:HemY protein